MSSIRPRAAEALPLGGENTTASGKPEAVMGRAESGRGTQVPSIRS
jgi:hypothetical protein